MGYCYGRLVPIERGYRQLSRYQQQLSAADRLVTAQTIVQAKLKNSRVLLMRQQQRQSATAIALAIQSLDYLVAQVSQAGSTARLMGFEGAGAASYFVALGECLSGNGFVFTARSRRPPGNPVNAMLSFGYQVLWNHLLSLIELQGLDPYYACLHGSNADELAVPQMRHAVLASDLIEEFRAPIVDSLMLYLVNRGMINAVDDFEFRDGGCFLNESGRKRYLRAFLQRMEESVQDEDGESQPRWDLLTRQVRSYRRFVYDPTRPYQPYLIR